MFGFVSFCNLQCSHKMCSASIIFRAKVINWCSILANFALHVIFLFILRKLLFHQGQSRAPDHERGNAVAAYKYAWGVNAGRIEDPGKDGESRKEKGYKGMGEQRRRVRDQKEGARKGAVPYLVNRGQQNWAVRRCLSQWELQKGMHLMR